MVGVNPMTAAEGTLRFLIIVLEVIQTDMPTHTHTHAHTHVHTHVHTHTLTCTHAQNEHPEGSYASQFEKADFATSFGVVGQTFRGPLVIARTRACVYVCKCVCG